MRFLFALFLFLFVIHKSEPKSKFVAVAEGKGFIQPCKDDDSTMENSNHLVKFDLKHEDAEDMETILTSGTVTVFADIPKNTPIVLIVDIFRWNRGAWQSTIFSLRRNDFCATAFSSVEPWYKFAQQLPEEERVCPPKIGSVYHLYNISNRIEIPDVKGMPDMAGRYKVIVHLIAGEQKFCLSFVTNTWKI